VRAYSPPELIAPDHEVDAFDCGSEAQTVWLRRFALQASRSDTTKVYVVCRPGMRTVVGYYALSAGSVAHEDAPDRITKGIGRYPIPVIVLTRLGVDVSEQGRGLGSGLVADAFLQVASIADRVGVRALLIHAESPSAAAFYRRISPAIQESPTDPLHLVLLIKDLRQAIREAAR
jgi:hypothetical protein